MEMREIMDLVEDQRHDIADEIREAIKIVRKAKLKSAADWMQRRLNLDLGVTDYPLPPVHTRHTR